MILTKTKDELRDQAKAALKQLSINKESFYIKQRALIDKLETLPEFKKSKVILTYYPFEYEFDLSSMIMAYPEKTWVLPRPIGKGIMLLFRVSNLLENLKAGKYGLKVPPGDSQLMRANELDLVIMPGLAFDKAGHRLGYGLGYYDRLLTKLKSTCKTIGVTDESLLLESIPAFDHDIAVNRVLTI